MNPENHANAINISIRLVYRSLFLWSLWYIFEIIIFCFCPLFIVCCSYTLLAVIDTVVTIASRCNLQHVILSFACWTRTPFTKHTDTHRETDSYGVVVFYVGLMPSRKAYQPLYLQTIDSNVIYLYTNLDMNDWLTRLLPLSTGWVVFGSKQKSEMICENRSLTP